MQTDFKDLQKKQTQNNFLMTNSNKMFQPISKMYDFICVFESSHAVCKISIGQRQFKGIKCSFMSQYLNNRTKL